MRAKLVIRLGSKPIRRCLLHSGQIFEIGRGRQVDIQLRGQGVSRRHAVLELKSDGLYLLDLGSRNGTLLDGHQVEANAEVEVPHRGAIQVGDYTLTAQVYRSVGDDAASGAARAQVQALVAAEGLDIRYQIGKGGTGTVWAAWQPSLNRMVAVKVLDGFDPEDRQRFVREARVCAKIESPNVIKLFDFRVERGHPYLVMELVPGMSALERLSEDEVPLSEALSIARDMAAALVALDEVGIVHRDVKPGNVLIGPDGVAKLTDFGIAKDLNSQTILTQAGMGLGTFSYMAPEQFQEARDVSSSADLYGLGASLYHLLAGRPPFVYSGRGNPAEFVEQIVNEPPPRVSEYRDDVPAEVVEFIHALLEKTPERRPRSAGVVYGVLHEMQRRYAQDQGDSQSSHDTLPLP